MSNKSRKSLSHYPQEYHELVLRAATGREAITVPMADRLQAVKMRGHFYAFVGAVKREADRLLSRSPTIATTDAEAAMIDTAKLAGQVLVQVEDEPPRLVFMSRDQSWQAQAARAALEALGVGKPQSEYDANGWFHGIPGLTRAVIEAADRLGIPRNEHGLPSRLPTDEEVDSLRDKPSRNYG